jgi:hypothetical protein
VKGVGINLPNRISTGRLTSASSSGKFNHDQGRKRPFFGQNLIPLFNASAPAIWNYAEQQGLQRVGQLPCDAASRLGITTATIFPTLW